MSISSFHCSRYVYTDDTAITAANVTGLLYTSRKYVVESLQESCEEFVEMSLSQENVCEVLQHCHGYGELDLEQKALNILKQSGVKVLQTEGFLSLSYVHLREFLQSDELAIEEEDLYEGVMSWVRERCKEEDVDLNQDNVRSAIGELRYEIRYTNMSGIYLVRSIGPSGILDERERLLIMDSIIDPDVDVSPFKRRARKNNSSVERDTSDIPEVDKWQYSHLF